MNLNDLKKDGAFVDDRLEDKEITWNDKTFTVKVKKLSFGATESIFGVDQSTLSEHKSQSAQVIIDCVRLGNKGDEVLTYKQAYSLDPKLATEFLKAIYEVNGLAESLKNA